MVRPLVEDDSTRRAAYACLVRIKRSARARAHSVRNFFIVFSAVRLLAGSTNAWRLPDWPFSLILNRDETRKINRPYRIFFVGFFLCTFVIFLFLINDFINETKDLGDARFYSCRWPRHGR